MWRTHGPVLVAAVTVVFAGCGANVTAEKPERLSEANASVGPGGD